MKILYNRMKIKVKANSALQCKGLIGSVGSISLTVQIRESGVNDKLRKVISLSVGSKGPATALT